MFVCEASERTRIKPIYLHGALLRALDFLDLRGPVWKAEEEVGWMRKGQAGPSPGSPRNFCPQTEVTPASLRQVFPHPAQGALLPPLVCSTQGLRGDGGAPRVESALLCAADLPGRSRSPNARCHPLPFPGDGGKCWDTAGPDPNRLRESQAGSLEP